MHALKAHGSAVGLLSCTVRMPDGAGQAEVDAAAKALLDGLAASCSALAVRGIDWRLMQIGVRIPPFLSCARAY